MTGLITRIVISTTRSLKLKCKVELNKNSSCWVWNASMTMYAEWVNRPLKLYEVLFTCETDVTHLPQISI